MCDKKASDRKNRKDIFCGNSFFAAAGLGAEVNVQNANGDQTRQVSQIAYLIEKGMDVIVIVAIDTGSEELARVIQDARKENISVIAYDRLIKNAGVDLYVSVDSEKVGELMARAAVEQIPPEGKIAAILGSPTDTNVELLEKGISGVLEEQGRSLVYKNYAQGWKAEYGYEYTEEF